MRAMLDSWMIPVNLALACYMTGLIWFVQVAHYSQFANVGVDAFANYHKRHVRLTTFVVGPTMLIEALAAVMLPFYVSAPDRSLAWIALLLLAIGWISTATLQVPCHNRLARCYDDATARRLVNTNWIRTAAWTLRAVLLLWLAARGSGVG